MKVRIDATNFQSADDGNTTHYGGTITVTMRSSDFQPGNTHM